MADKQAPIDISTHRQQRSPEQGRETDLTEATVKMRDTVISMAEAKFGPMPAEDAMVFKQFALDRLFDFLHAVTDAETYDAVREQFFRTVFPPEGGAADQRT